MKRVLRRLSPSMIVALVALFVALGGTGYAALTITGKNVKNSSLTGRDIKNNSVRSADVARLLATDFKAGQLPAGPRGATGPQGPKGDTGPPGAPATTLWANVLNSAGGPTLARGSGAVSASDAGTGRVRVRFNQAVDECSYQATGWLEEEGTTTWVHPPILTVFRDLFNHAATDLEVQTYSQDTGALDSDNYGFTVAVFC